MPNGLVEHPTPAPFPFGPSTIADVLVEGVANHPDRLALIDGDRSWTYAELDAAVASEASRLWNPGGLSFWDLQHSEVIIAVLAGFRVSEVWVACKTLPELDDLAHLVRPKRGNPAASSPAIVAFTSGTTGQPKRVVHNHHGVLLPALVSRDVEPPVAGERIGTPLSLRIANVMILGPLSAFVRGSTFVVMRDRSPEGMAADIKRHRITRLFAVPTLAHDLVECRSVKRRHLKSLDRVVLGGSGGRPETLRSFEERFGVRPTLSYGLSEAPTGVARESLDDPIGSGRGHPLPHVEIAVRDPETGDEVPVGEIGEVCLRAAQNGPWAGCWTGTLGYIGEPERTAALFQDGLLHTGDLGKVDHEGAVSITGRLSDLIIRGGKNIDPRAVEASLEALNGILAAASVGVDDERLGEVVGAVVEVGIDVAPDQVARQIETAGIRLDRLVCTTSLPRNDMGKPDRQALLQLLEDA